MLAPTILLVDDEPFFLNLQRDFLKQSPVTVQTAATCQEALDMARKHRPKLIYLDYRLPDTEGASCCATIKADPELQGVPVVMVVTAGREREEAFCRSAGCDALITKPLDRSVFLSTGRRFLPDVDRRMARVRYSALAVLKTLNASHHGTIEDISHRGAYVAARCPLNVNEELRLGCMLNGEGFVEADARVAWTNLGPRRGKQALPEGFGVEFTALPDSISGRLRNLINGVDGGET